MRALGLVALLALGCEPSTPEPRPVVSNPPVPSAKVAEPPKPKSKAGTNPNRINQLADLKKVDLSLKGHPVHLWLMDDEGKQREGMMFLTDGEVKADEGMLFAFDAVQPNDGRHSFWMQNTILPLDIVYLSPQGKVLNVGKGVPYRESPSVAPAGDYLNVIELKAGTAARYGLKPGDVVKVPKP